MEANNLRNEHRSSPKLIFACSGAADVGEIADRAARKMTRDGVGKMFCLAGVGGRVEGIMLSTRAAQGILAIDGCSQNCASKCLEMAGVSRFNHLQMGDLGMAKGETDVSESNIAKVAENGAGMLQEMIQ